MESLAHGVSLMRHLFNQETLCLTGLACLAIPITLVVLILCMITPAALGEASGVEAAKHDLAYFKKGCEAANIAAGCLELRKGSEVLARGFVIDSTDSHIAIFDVQQQRARALERAGTELIGDTPTALISLPNTKPKSDGS